MKINFSEKTISTDFDIWFQSAVCIVSENFAVEHDLSIRKVWLNFMTHPELLPLLVQLFAEQKFNVDAFDLRPMPAWGLEISDEVIMQLKLRVGDFDYFENNGWDSRDDDDYIEGKEDED